MQNEIIYFFDPICGWCYGFSEHMSRFYDKHREEYEFRVVTGGMVRGEHAGAIGEKAELLNEAYPRVEEMTGVVFGKKFFERLKEGSTVFGSDVPSLVFHAISGKLPGEGVRVAKAVQSAIYTEGIAPMDILTYGSVAKQFDLGLDELEVLIESEEVKEAYTLDLYMTQQFGISGFPFAVVSLDGEYYQLAKGFRSEEDLEVVLGKALEYHASREGS
jgi:putative protein-disulfide isomerase